MRARHFATDEWGSGDSGFLDFGATIGGTMDPDDYRRFPHLYNAVLGIPPWLRFFRYANNINSLIAIALAVYLAFATSLWTGVGYAAIFFIALWLATVMTAVSRTSVTAMIVSSTVALTAVNIGLAWWFFAG